MRILYLTTALDQQNFNALCAASAKKPNPAGQNFHRKMIEALRLSEEIEVLSLVPSSFHPVEVDGFLYAEKDAIPCFRAKRIAEKTLDIQKTFPFEVILYDSLQVALAKASLVLSKKLHLPRVAICTDNPTLISGVPASYPKRVLSLSQDADGYFALTGDLNKLFNPSQKPSLIQMGVVEEIPSSLSLWDKPYLYFGGALYKRYGTDALLDAFQKANPDYDLLISGHGPEEATIREAAKKNSRIRFLGQVSTEKHYGYLNNASLLINPRPYDEQLERYSVPSKLLEYLCSGAPIVSTKNNTVFAQYGESINEAEDLYAFLEKHLNKQGKFNKLKPNLAKEKVLKDLGLESTGKAFADFLTSLTR